MTLLVRRIAMGLLVISGIVGYFTGRSVSESQIRIFIDNKEITTDVPAIIQNNRVLVPLRAVAENLGAQVSWDGESRTVNLCSRIAAETKRIDSGLPDLLSGGALPMPAAPRSVDPRMTSSDGTTPGWSEIKKLECGSWNAITHMFVGVDANPAVRGNWLTVTSIGLSRDLAATTLKDTNGFYPQGEGPDAVYVSVIPPSPVDKPLVYYVNPTEIKRSGIQVARFKLPVDWQPGTATLVIAWAWQGREGGFRRFGTLRLLEIGY